ncbi:MAG: hypothetical protein ACRCTZ_02770 [Sarcina sp.]
MGNGFVGYLNSMNNASSDNINALAESQVSNEFYKSIMVERKLGSFITDKIKAGESNCYIISGYAGDGKTSILVQILKELDLLIEGEGLKIQDEKLLNGKKITYVKDMSELSDESKLKLLEEALNIPKQKGNSILISNTGPLINTFVKLFAKNDSDKRDEIENKLLKQLDENKLQELEIEGFKFTLINIARIDNIGFVKEIIDKICMDNLWNSCEGCASEKHCPVYFNKKSVCENKQRVIQFIEDYYTFLKEHDKRLTIRQIISQISFAMTGNLKCSEIRKRNEDKFYLFRYNFANLFFGYTGSGKLLEGTQIRAIRLLQDEGFDAISLDQDYDMFVKGEFNYFTDNIRELITGVWNEFSKNFYESNYDFEDKISKQQEIRKSIRRFLLLYGILNKNERSIRTQIYGDVFDVYRKLTKESAAKSDKSSMLNKIINALYIKNMGVSQKEKNLYLTLKKNNDEINSVLIVLAKIENREFKLEQVKRNLDIEDSSEGYKLNLSIGKRDSVEFELTLPILMYFDSINAGEINTDINPSLSYGLDKLNAALVKRFRDEDTEEKMEIILIDANNNVKEISLDFSDEDEIIFE